MVDCKSEFPVKRSICGTLAGGEEVEVGQQMPPEVQGEFPVPEEEEDLKWTIEEIDLWPCYCLQVVVPQWHVMDVLHIIVLTE